MTEHFAITEQAIDPNALREQLTQKANCGAFCSFEGWVRDHNDGKNVDYLIYSTYPELGLSQGNAVIEQAPCGPFGHRRYGGLGGRYRRPPRRRFCRLPLHYRHGESRSADLETGILRGQPAPNCLVGQSGSLITQSAKKQPALGAISTVQAAFSF